MLKRMFAVVIPVTVLLTVVLGYTIFMCAEDKPEAAGGPYVADKDTVLLMHFDEVREQNVVADESKNRNKGTLIEKVEITTGGGGKFGEGLKTAQEYGWVEVKDNESLAITGPITVECWLKPAVDYPAKPPEWRGIVTKGYSNEESYGLSYACWTGELDFAIMDEGKRYVAVKAMPLDAGKWYHLAGAYDGETIRLLVDGKEVASTPHKGKITPNNMPLSIGRGGSGARWFTGIIDEVRISNGVRY